MAAGAIAEEPSPTPTPVALIPVEGEMVAQANRTLQLAGLPGLPAKAIAYNCYSWSGLSAGVYASFVLEKEAFDAWLARLPGGMDKTSPIPASLLSPPNDAAPWFSPSSLEEGYVVARGRISGAAPELYRVYVDPKNFKIQFYYSWNNKRTYP